MLVRDLNAFVHGTKLLRVGDAHFWRLALTRLCAEWALALDIPNKAARSEIERTMNIAAGSPSGGSGYDIQFAYADGHNAQLNTARVRPSRAANLKAKRATRP